ncbi:MAG: M2 family metallopeptidase [Bacteroidia bacterium]|nr:M2 family metallopeptidase [Bacteroidia bacterium]
MKQYLLISLAAFALASCSNNKKVQQETQQFLDAYNKKYTELSVAANEAQWKVNTMIVEGDSSNALAAEAANKAYAAFTGSKENIETAKKMLEQKDMLTELQVKQLNKILYLAANNPETLKSLVDERIKAETAQTEKLFGFNFTINGKAVSTNDIDEILGSETDLAKRQAAWEASKEVGKTLKDGLANLQRLRNETVKGLGYADFFTYQVSDYGMTTDEMMQLNKQFIKELWPLYRELHTYARYELAAKYGVKEVPANIPAHWLTNRWGQDWGAMIEVEGLNLDSSLKTKNAEWLVKEGERFYKSLGFESLPETFWQKSSLYPVAPDAAYKKNNHASAWHMDLNRDVRSLMSVVPNTEWYETVNHELGHIYYYLSYSTPEIPPLLREGANRAYHEAFGTMIGLAAMQKAFLSNNGLLPAGTATDEMKTLLKQALNSVVFIPFSAGTMTHFEHDLYVKNLPKEQYNTRWWDLVKKYQGIEPPAARSEIWCDAASKTHINDDAAQYYDYALSYIILYQVHNHIATNILKQDPHNCNYFGSKATGDFLRDIMKYGASKDWRAVLKEKTGSDLSAAAMLKYFEPLLPYLKELNKGRTYTLPETID